MEIEEKRGAEQRSEYDPDNPDGPFENPGKWGRGESAMTVEEFDEWTWELMVKIRRERPDRMNDDSWRECQRIFSKDKESTSSG